MEISLEYVKKKKNQEFIPHYGSLMESWMLEINNPNLKWTKEAFEGPCYEKRATHPVLSFG